MNQMAVNNRGWKVQTQEGYVDFQGISDQGIKHIWKVLFDDGTDIDASNNHVFFTEDGREIRTKELMIGLVLIGIPNKTITSISYVGEETTYDIINTETHTYFANGLLCHNCIFLSSDALLISSILLHTLNDQVNMTEPDARGINWWCNFEKGKTYLIGVDPATGSGNDFSSIEVFSFPDLQQVAEFRSNTTSSPVLYLTLVWILKKASMAGSNVYFSVENNGVGEGIISLYQADENPPHVGEFVSEEGKGRLGMTTTGKSKIRACLNFKQLVERSKLGIRSKSLLGEMKNYARKNGSYEAQIGSTDDSISAVLIVLRLLEEISTYEQDAYDTLYSVSEEEYFGEYDESDVGLAMSMGDSAGGYGGAGGFTDPNDPNSFDPFA